MSTLVDEFVATSYVLSSAIAMMVVTTWTRNFYFPWPWYVLVQYIILWYVGHRAEHANLPFLDAVLIFDAAAALIGVVAGYIAAHLLRSPRMLALQYDSRGRNDTRQSWCYLWLGIGQVLLIVVAPLLLHDFLLPFRPWDAVSVVAFVGTFWLAYQTHCAMAPKWAANVRTDRHYDGQEVDPPRSLVGKASLARFYLIYAGLVVFMVIAFVTVDNILWFSGVSPTTLDPLWRLLALAGSAALYLGILWFSLRHGSGGVTRRKTKKTKREKEPTGAYRL